MTNNQNQMFLFPLTTTTINKRTKKQKHFRKWRQGYQAPSKFSHFSADSLELMNSNYISTYKSNDGEYIL